MNKTSFISSLVFYIFFLLLFTNCHGDDHPFVDGNFHIALGVKHGISYDKHTLKGNASDLWCGATIDGETTLPLRDSESYFENTNTKKVFSKENKDVKAKAKLDIVNGSIAYLQFSNNTISINESGQYVCVLTTKDNQTVRHDLFVYLRPVFHTNGSLRLKIEDEKHSPFKITASSTKVLRGETAVLGCPAIGYPTPTITWYKRENKRLLELESLKRYEFRGNELIIHNLEYTDEEIYRCVAENNFSISVNEPILYESFNATLYQRLRVARPLSWLRPLLILLTIIALLVVIIYGHQIREERKRKQQYNAAEKREIPQLVGKK